jgi:hypothetical protein
MREPESTRTRPGGLMSRVDVSLVQPSWLPAGHDDAPDLKSTVILMAQEIQAGWPWGKQQLLWVRAMGWILMARAVVAPLL